MNLSALRIEDLPDLKTSIEGIAQMARKEFSADLCFTISVNPYTQQLMESPIWVSDPGTSFDQTRLNKVAHNLLSRELTRFDSSIAQDREMLDQLGLCEISSLIAVTLRVQPHRPLAVIFIGYNHNRTFDSAAQEKLQVFAQHTALRLKNTWLLLRYREVAKISQEINLSLEQTNEAIFEKLRTRMAEIIDTSYSLLLAVHQPRKPEGTLHSEEARLMDLYVSERDKVTHQRLPQDYPIFNEATPKLIRHYDEEAGKAVPHLKQVEGTRQAIPQSLIFVPLIFRGDSFGVLSVQHINPNVYDNEDLQLLELVGNQVAQSLANQRLYGYLNELNITGRELTQQLDTERLSKEVVDRICKTAEADVVVLYLYNEKRPVDDKFVMPPYISGALLNPDYAKPRVSPEGIAVLVLEKGEPTFMKETAELHEFLGGDAKKRTGNFEEREQIKSTAALTLKIGDETVGVLFINYRTPQRFDAPQKTLIESLASYAAIGIRNSRLLNRSNRLASLRLIDRAISKTLDQQQAFKLEQVLETILIEATKVVKADEAAVILYNDQNKTLEIKASIGQKTAERKKLDIPLDRGRGITKWVFENKEPARVGNVHKDSPWKDIYNKFSEDTISELDVPLLDDDDIIGVINFESNEERAYSQADLDFVTNLEVQAVLAVKNSRLYEREQRAANEQRAMQEIGREIVKHLDLKAVLENILNKALELTKSKAGQVLLYNSRRNELHGKVERGVLDKYIGVKLKEGEGIVWAAMKRREALDIDVTDPVWKDKFYSTIPDAKWELAVPILDGDRGLGVINIERTVDSPFTEIDKRLITQLADLAFIALRNAEQYKEVEERRAQLEALHNVDLRIIEQKDNIQESVNAIIEAAGELASAEIAGLHLYQKGLPQITYLTREEVVQNDGGLTLWKPLLRRDTHEGGVVEYVRQTGGTHLTHGDAQDDLYYQGDTKIHSEVAAPLKLDDGTVVGVLNLESPREFAFDKDNAVVLELLAAQAVIAIQNALNFIEAREESNRFKLLVDVGRSLGSITSPEQKSHALDIFFEKMRGRYSEGHIIYRRYDREREEFVLEKHEGTSEPPQNIKGTDGLNGQVMKVRCAILVKDKDNLEEGNARPTTPDYIKTLVVAPVVFENRYYGNITLRHAKSGYYQESDRLLLEGMATQLAITLRRLEAVEAQREAEQQARNLEFFTELGVWAYEITHRLGNELGLVETSVNIIRDVLEEHQIASIKIDEELDKVVKDVSQVLGMSKGLKKKVAKLHDGGKSVLPVKTILEEAKWVPSRANIEMVWTVADDLGFVNVVAGQIIDILYTLINNAVEAMPDGGRITIQAFNLGSDVQVEVADNGPGILSDNQSKIFNLFFSTKRSSGFGLWSARRYARANGGDLTVRSELGKGATFTLKLPLVTSENGAL